MKRSEMRQIIAEYIIFSGDDDMSAQAKAEEIAKDVLEVIELNGMYPPCRRDGKLDWDPE